MERHGDCSFSVQVHNCAFWSPCSGPWIQGTAQTLYCSSTPRHCLYHTEGFCVRNITPYLRVCVHTHVTPRQHMALLLVRSICSLDKNAELIWSGSRLRAVTVHTITLPVSPRVCVHNMYQAIQVLNSLKNRLPN